MFKNIHGLRGLTPTGWSVNQTPSGGGRKIVIEKAIGKFTLPVLDTTPPGGPHGAITPHGGPRAHVCINYETTQQLLISNLKARFYLPSNMI